MKNKSHSIPSIYIYSVINTTDKLIRIPYLLREADDNLYCENGRVPKNRKYSIDNLLNLISKVITQLTLYQMELEHEVPNQRRGKGEGDIINILEGKRFDEHPTKRDPCNRYIIDKQWGSKNTNTDVDIQYQRR